MTSEWVTTGTSQHNQLNLALTSEHRPAEDGSDVQHSIRTIHWEILEQIDLWPNPCPLIVCVEQVACGSPSLEGDLDGASPRTEDIDIFNIIIVSARPGSTDNIPTV
jgi:hypothetical protein